MNVWGTYSGRKEKLQRKCSNFGRKYLLSDGELYRMLKTNELPAEVLVRMETQRGATNAACKLRMQ